MLDFYDSPADKSKATKSKLMDSPGAEQLLNEFSGDSSSSPILKLLDRSPRLKIYQSNKIKNIGKKSTKCVKKFIEFETSEPTSVIKEAPSGNEAGMALEIPQNKQNTVVSRVINRAMKAFDDTSSSTDHDMLFEFENNSIPKEKKRKILHGKGKLFEF